MADRQVVLSAPLCFLFTKFGKLDIKRIKTGLVDFYSSEEITAAKERLVKDVQALSLDGMPTIARRRNSDNRYQRECDDMVDIITFLDERKFSAFCRTTHSTAPIIFRQPIWTKETCACSCVS